MRETQVNPSELALDGGKPLRTMSMPGWPAFDEEMIDTVGQVLRSGKVNYWTGEQGRLFEQEYAESVNAKYAVAVANGTLALELALHALEIGAGDEVIVTSRTFIASASSVVMRGATPVFADVDPNSQNITAASIEDVLTPRTRAIIAVHLAGWPCEMDAIMGLAERHHLHVIEDCAQAHGARYRGRPVGSIGDVGAFSFCQDKILTTGGEGGLLVTNAQTTWKRAWAYKDHGKSWDTVHNQVHPPGFRWLHESFGTNWRLTEMQSALGRRLLQRLPVWGSRRREFARRLAACCEPIAGLRVPTPPRDIEHAYYKFYAFVSPDQLRPGWDRDRISAAINAEGIPCMSGSCSEVYREAAFPPHLRPPHRLPVARRLGETSLMFLVHPTLDDTDILDTCRAIEKVMSVAGARRNVAA